MRHFSNSSIKRKQMWIILLASSVTLLLAGTGFVICEVVAFREAMVQNLTSTATILGNNCTAPLDFNVPKDAEEVLKALQGEPHIVAARIYGKDHQTFATYLRAGSGQDALPEVAPAAEHRFSKDDLTLCQPITVKGEQIGSLFMKSDLQALWSRFNQYVSIVGIVLAASLLGAFLLSVWLQRVISVPILELAAVAQAVAVQKNYSVRVTSRRRDEIGQLIDGFNEMLAQIQTRDAALEQARGQLEERVEARTRELEQSLSLLKATLESAADGIMVVDSQKHVTRYNGKFAVMWSLPDAVLQTKDDRQLLNFVLEQLQDSESFLRRVQELYARPEEDSFDVLQLKDGRIFERYSQAHRVGGTCQGRVWCFRDVTNRKKAEQERELMQMQLQQAQKLESVGQLAAGIAHEINTPTQYVGDNTRFLKDCFDSIIKVLQSYEELLNAVKNGGPTPEMIKRLDELLAASDLTYLFEQVPAAIKETLEGVERVTKIVRAMKEFSHPGGKEKAASDLNKAIESTVTVARNEWKYVADMELDLDPQLPVVPCFLGEFNQCILNLVVNAAHAIGDVVKQRPGTKGKITIRSRRDGDHVEIRVSDTGTGIPESARSRIFEPFFTTKDVGKGTGQGLAIIYGSVVKKHGGAVRFETETGKGTTFILRLPISARTVEVKPAKDAVLTLPAGTPALAP